MQINISSEIHGTEITKNKYYLLYKQLKPLVESYGGGLAALAQKVSISKPTLWRWINFKNSKAPNPYHVLSLVKFITKKENISELSDCVGGEIEKFLKSSFPADFEVQAKSNTVDLNSLFEDFYSYFIYLLCGTEKIMTRSKLKVILGTYSLEQLGLSIEDSSLTTDILESVGQVAELKINNLIDHQILTELDGRLIRLMNSSRIKVSISKKHLPKLYTFFKEKNMHKKSNMMYAYQESVPQETIKKIIDLQYEAFMKCYKLMERDKTPDGEIYMLSTYFENFNFE